MTISTTGRSDLFCSGTTKIKRLRGGKVNEAGQFVLIFDLEDTLDKIRAVLDINAVIKVERVRFKSRFVDYGTNDGIIKRKYHVLPLYLKNVLRREWFDRYDRVAKMAKYQCI